MQDKGKGHILIYCNNCKLTTKLIKSFIIHVRVLNNFRVVNFLNNFLGGNFSFAIFWQLQKLWQLSPVKISNSKVHVRDVENWYSF